MARSEMQLLPGCEVGPGYILVSWLGSGGFGEVWQAVAPDNTACALKFIDLGREALAARESRSLHFMKTLRHPHVLAIGDVFSIDHSLVICMELGQGTLKDRLEECQRQGLPGMPVAELMEALRQVAAGIDFLNAPSHLLDGVEGLRIVHQDIKPQNLLRVGGTLKVADFGLARVIEESLAEKSTGGLTPAYAAPEVFRGETAEQSDQYSLAVSYCQLRGGRLPFTGNFYKLMAGHMTGAPDLSMVPEGERPVVARALSKDRQERWPNCTAFVEALRQGLAPDQPGAEPCDSRPSATTVEYLPEDA